MASTNVLHAVCSAYANALALKGRGLAKANNSALKNLRANLDEKRRYRFDAALVQNLSRMNLPNAAKAAVNEALKDG